MIWLLGIAGLLAIASLFLSTQFFALRDYSMHKLEQLAERNGGFDKLRPIVDNDEGYARSVALVRLVVNLVVVLLIALAFAPLYTPVDPEAPVSALGRIDWLAIGKTLGVSLGVLFLVSVILPVSLAQHAGERVIHKSAKWLRIMHAMTTPLAAFSVLDVAVKRLVGDSQATERTEAEDEVLSAVSEGALGGHIGDAEREMIENVVGMAEMTVDEIMTPRTDVDGFEYTDDLTEIKAHLSDIGHSRIPVYEGDLDHIVGILYVKDLLPFVNHTPERFVLRDILRPVTVVPETKPAHQLLVELQAGKVHLAIVVDEYGGTAGVVTLEDILEEIVGEIQDEYEDESDTPDAVSFSADTRAAEVDARVNVDDVNEAMLALGSELEESDDYDTLGGYVLSRLGRIPQVGESFQADGCVIDVLDAEPTRIHRLRVTVLEQREDDEPAGPAVDESENPSSGVSLEQAQRQESV